MEAVRWLRRQRPPRCGDATCYDEHGAPVDLDTLRSFRCGCGRRIYLDPGTRLRELEAENEVLRRIVTGQAQLDTLQTTLDRHHAETMAWWNTQHPTEEN